MVLEQVIKLTFWIVLLCITIYQIFYRIYFVINHRRKLRKRGYKVPALVVELEKEMDLDGLTIYRPMFEFKDENGKVLRVKENTSSANPPRIGDKVTLYHGRNTEDFYRKGSMIWEIFLLPFGIIIVYMIMFVIYNIITNM